ERQRAGARRARAPDHDVAAGSGRWRAPDDPRPLDARPRPDARAARRRARKAVRAVRLNARARDSGDGLAVSAPGAHPARASVSSMRDGPRDECGVFGLYAPGHEVSRLSYFALYALQHRGQESAGIAAADRDGQIVTRRELGLVSQVFSENDLRTLAGELAIGHVRYSTTGSNAWENSQPVQRSEGTKGSRREVALAHNGNLINPLELPEELLARGAPLS